MKKLYDGPFYYKRYDAPWAKDKDSMCHLRIWLKEGLGQENYIVLAEESPQNQGLSVTNGIERIASAVWTEFELIDPNRVSWFERYPGLKDYANRVDAVDMVYDYASKSWRSPSWRYQPLDGLEATVQEKLSQ